jgi:sugar/nucleoside kinase (ribokinase family)
VLARFAPEAELRCAVAAAAAAALVLGAPGVQQWEPEAEAVEAWLVE